MDTISISMSTSFGPSRPPSTWRLDHIPGPILDRIVDHLIQDQGPPTRKLSPDLRNVAVVDDACRKSVFAKKKCLDLVQVRSRDEVMNAVEMANKVTSPLIKRLVIAVEQRIDNFQAFGVVVRSLMGHIEHLDWFETKLPNLPGPRFSQESRLSSGSNLPGFFPGHLKGLDTFVMDIPFCTPEKASAREAHWWGYFSWLFFTPTKIKRIVVTMTFDADMIPQERPTQRDVAIAMGLGHISGYQSLFAGSWVCRDNRVDTMTLDMKDFLAALLHARPAFEQITIIYKVFLRMRGMHNILGNDVAKPFRTLHASRVIGTSGLQDTIACTDKIDLEREGLVNSAIQDMSDLSLIFPILASFNRRPQRTDQALPSNAESRR